MVYKWMFPKESCNLIWSENILEGKISENRYGLLGPSGCGKTTLLRCVVGRLQLNDGEIIVYGKRPGSRGHDIPGRSVGFMPQETALYQNFTISEMLFYFGRLHHMKRKVIFSREEFLLSFLDIPWKNKKILQLRFVIHSYGWREYLVLFFPPFQVVDNNVVYRWHVHFFKNRNY